jgi:hypothetical protein
MIRVSPPHLRNISQYLNWGCIHGSQLKLS